MTTKTVLRYAFCIAALALPFGLGTASTTTTTAGGLSKEEEEDGHSSLPYRCKYPYTAKDDTEVTIDVPNYLIKSVNYASSNGQWCHVTIDRRERGSVAGFIPCSYLNHPFPSPPLTDLKVTPRNTPGDHIVDKKGPAPLLWKSRIPNDDKDNPFLSVTVVYCTESLTAPESQYQCFYEDVKTHRVQALLVDEDMLCIESHDDCPSSGMLPSGPRLDDSKHIQYPKFKIGSRKLEVIYPRDLPNRPLDVLEGDTLYLFKRSETKETKRLGMQCGWCRVLRVRHRASGGNQYDVGEVPCSCFPIEALALKEVKTYTPETSLPPLMHINPVFDFSCVNLNLNKPTGPICVMHTDTILVSTRLLTGSWVEYLAIDNNWYPFPAFYAFGMDCLRVLKFNPLKPEYLFTGKEDQLRINAPVPIKVTGKIVQDFKLGKKSNIQCLYMTMADSSEVALQYDQTQPIEALRGRAFYSECADRAYCKKLWSSLKLARLWHVCYQILWNRDRDNVTKYFQQLRMDKLLGKGAYGQVSRFKFEGKLPPDLKLLSGEEEPATEVAVKVSPMDLAVAVDSLHTEIEALYSLTRDSKNHPSPWLFPKLYNVTIEMSDEKDNEGMAVVKVAMEYIVGVPLSKLIRQGTKFSQDNISWIIWQLVKGLDVLHQYKVIHGDFKPNNVMVRIPQIGDPMDTLQLIIIDLGSAKNFNDSSYYRPTLPYCPPELIKELHCKGLLPKGFKVNLEKTDVWSLGVVALEIFTGCLHHNFVYTPEEKSGYDDAKFIRQIRGHKWRPFDFGTMAFKGFMNSRLDAFITKCLLDQDRRPLLTALLDDPLFDIVEPMHLSMLTDKLVYGVHDNIPAAPSLTVAPPKPLKEKKLLAKPILENE